MEILNLNVNENYNDWGIKRTSKSKTIVLQNKSQEFEVFKFQWTFLFITLQMEECLWRLNALKMKNTLIWLL